MTKEALIQRLHEEATYDLHHETVAILKEAAQAIQELRTWVGLTVQEIEAIGKPFEEKDRSIQDWGLFACAIEAKLRELNT